MAINNSIALGKTTGSIGNVTFARLKGQQVSKSKIEAKGAILPANQSPAQIQMKNIVMTYQVIAMFLQFATGLRKSTESVFNAYVRIFVGTMSNVLSPSPWDALTSLIDKVITSGNFINSGIISFVNGTITIALNTGGLPFVAGSYIAALKVIELTGVNISGNHLITEAEWNAGIVTFALVLDGATATMTYIYNVAAKKCSEPVYTQP